MAELDLAFLWHMHQPYYPDPLAKVYPMPWVRLHGVKGYYDMAALLKEYPHAKYTINLTPSLMRQLKEYVDLGIQDEYWKLSVKKASELSMLEKIFLLKNFFLCRRETMIQPYPRYLRLLNKRGTRAGINLERSARDFSSADFLDLQVWFNLAWFGFTALKEYPELRELQNKGRDFREEDKIYILNLQLEIMKKLIPLYRELWNAGKLEISTTPFYHPILPLLCDSDIAREASPWIKLPPRFSHPEDANLQIKTGLEYLESCLGRRPVGMWPSENAVSDQALRILAENGVSWANTDEMLLRKIRPTRPRSELVYRPYAFQDTALKLVFRDQELSDLISFNYSKLEAPVAVADFSRRLDGIRKQAERTGRPRALVLVALDGENPWESFPESGHKFLSALCEELAKKDGCSMATVSEAISAHSPERLDHIAPGTWINGDFEVWIGGSEENQAWGYLGKVREELDPLLKTADAEARDAALSELFAAEGSDWFWWYGDTFYTDLDTEFDELFRTHLRNAYLALGRIPPLFLEESVKHDHPVRLTAPPVEFISPILDGRESSFYEWQGAGCFDVMKVTSTRYTEDPYFSKIFFGFDLDHLYLRLDPHRPELVTEDLKIEIHFEKPSPCRISFPYHLEKSPAQKYVLAKPGDWEELTLEKNTIHKEKVYELAALFSELGFAPGAEVWFQVHVLLGEQLLAWYPRDGLISFKVPDKDFESRMWTI